MRHQRCHDNEPFGEPDLVKRLKSAPDIEQSEEKPKTREQKMFLCEFIRSMRAASRNPRGPKSINK